MQTIAEIEEAIPKLSAVELANLEELVRKARREKENGRRPSLRDIAPSDVGRMLQPLGNRDDWYDEMREAKG